MSITKNAAPRFPVTFCSQCGEEFGPGNHGFSHCSDHEQSWDDDPLAFSQLPSQRDPLAALEECARDAARLDWIARQSLEDLAMGIVIDSNHDGEYYVCGDDYKMHYGETLRAAIDAAKAPPAPALAKEG